MAINTDIEREASLFAMLLLMPEQFFKEDMKQSVDLADDKAINELAKKYQVSTTLVCARIAHFSKYKR